MIKSQEEKIKEFENEQLRQSRMKYIENFVNKTLPLGMMEKGFEINLPNDVKISLNDEGFTLTESGIEYHQSKMSSEQLHFVILFLDYFRYEAMIFVNKE